LDRTTTLMIFAAAAGLAALAWWGDRYRRTHPHAPLALLPWHGLMFVSLVALLFMGVHLITLSGAD
jgi:hypothetical protein